MVRVQGYELKRKGERDIETFELFFFDLSKRLGILNLENIPSSSSI